MARQGSRLSGAAMGWAAVAVVVVGTAALVGAALRPAAKPAVRLAPSAAAVAVADDRAWRWFGAADCSRTTDGRAGTTLEVREEGEWRTARVPLGVIRQLSFSDDLRGVALGTDESCRPQLAATEDGGRTWRRVPTGGAIESAGRGGNAVWSVVRRGAAATVVARRDDVDSESAPVTTPPCETADGAPSYIDVVSESTAWVICQMPRSFRRALLRTSDGGGRWERRTTGRVGGGLDGLGSVTAVDMGSGPRGWMVLTTDRCSDADLRATDDAGLTWTRLPCPSSSTPLRLVFALDIDDDGHGLLLGVRAGAPVTLETSDGGRSWRPA